MISKKCSNNFLTTRTNFKNAWTIFLKCDHFLIVIFLNYAFFEIVNKFYNSKLNLKVLNIFLKSDFFKLLFLKK